MGIFDNDKSKIGTFIGEHVILDVNIIKEFIETHKPDIGIIAVPKETAADIALLLSECGIKGLLNFSYTDISVLKGVEVENVHISDSLMTLSYRIRNHFQQ